MSTLYWLTGQLNNKSDKDRDDGIYTGSLENHKVEPADGQVMVYLDKNGKVLAVTAGDYPIAFDTRVVDPTAVAQHRAVYKAHRQLQPSRISGMRARTPKCS
jgi:hypothetical protein